MCLVRWDVCLPHAWSTRNEPPKERCTHLALSRIQASRPVAHANTQGLLFLFPPLLSAAGGLAGMGRYRMTGSKRLDLRVNGLMCLATTHGCSGPVLRNAPWAAQKNLGSSLLHSHVSLGRTVAFKQFEASNQTMWLQYYAVLSRPSPGVKSGSSTIQMPPPTKEAPRPVLNAASPSRVFHIFRSLDLGDLNLVPVPNIRNQPAELLP